MVKTDNMQQFNTINFLASFPLAIIAIQAGLYANALVSIFFGVVGFYGIVKRYKEISNT